MTLFSTWFTFLMNWVSPSILINFAHPLSTSLTCLGITIDVNNHTLSIEDGKIKAIWQECISILNKTYVSRNKFQSLLGKLLYIYKCVKLARIFINRILALFRSNHNHNRIRLTPDFFQDLIWFIKFIPDFNGCTYFNKSLPSPDKHVFVDTSLAGLGAYWNGRAYATPVSSILGSELGIVQLEMFNILLALRCWASLWAHQSILIHFDNMAVVQVVQSKVLLLTSSPCWKGDFQTGSFCANIQKKF